MQQIGVRVSRAFLILALAVAAISTGACSATPPTEPTVASVQPAVGVAIQPTDRPGSVTGKPTTELREPTATQVPTAQPTMPAAATSSPTVPPTPEIARPQSSVADIIAGLEGLTIDEFFEESYKQLLLRNPEYLTALGLARSFGLRNDRLNDLSAEYLRETQELQATILDQLRAYDRDQLDPEQQVSYDVYEWYLDNLVRGHEFAYHNYPVHHFLGSYQDELMRLLTETHPLRDRQDAEDYVARLSQVEDQVGQLLEGLWVREEIGVIPPAFIVNMTLGDLRRLAQGEASSSPFYTAFAEKLGKVPGLSEADQQALLASAEEEISSGLMPAFATLLEYFEEIQPTATDDAGLWRLPDGEAYYAYLLRSQTSTDLSPEEIHELGLAEVARIQAEMRREADSLGYPSDIGIDELMSRVVEDGGFYATESQEGKDQLLKSLEAMLDEVDREMDVAFDIRPQAEVVVVGDPGFSGGGYYVSGTMDGSRPGAFHTGVGGSWVPKFNMPTIAYHEAIPGHHFQIAIAQEADLPTFRTDVFFNGYGEGWALYAEQLAWELGLYEDDPHGNLGRLHLELLRAVRLVADTGIHHLGWTREEAKDYMNEAMGGWTHEVERYVVMPAQATGYKIGMLKILELRQRAMDEMGAQFDLKEFHNVVLKNGSMPLEILEDVVQAYIDSKLGTTSSNLAVASEAAYVPVFEAVDCQFEHDTSHEVECGYLIVPEKHSQPENGKTVRLHVAIFRSNSPDPLPDPVIYVSGAGNQLDSHDRYLFAGGDEILKNRDYVMYNQRGAKYNQPALDCRDLTGLAWGLAAKDLISKESDDRFIQRVLECYDDLLEQGIDLTAYNTVENAADVDDLRRVLGYEQVNLYGTSYGTRLALTIMRYYPDTVRSAILDSVYPPDVNLFVEDGTNIHRAFQQVWESCAADPYCSETYPDLEAVFYQTVDELNANPVPLELDRGTILVDGDLFVTGLYLKLFSADAVSRIPKWIDRASQAKFDSHIARTFEIVMDWKGTGLGTFWSLYCNEEIPFGSYDDSLAMAAELPPQIGGVFPRYLDFSVCESWESGQADPMENTAVASDIPSLILAGQFDPVTPPEWGRRASQTLGNSYYYEFPGLSHGIMRSDECGLEIGLQFIDDPSIEPDASCMKHLAGPEFD